MTRVLLLASLAAACGDTPLSPSPHGHSWLLFSEVRNDGSDRYPAHTYARTTTQIVCHGRCVLSSTEDGHGPLMVDNRILLNGQNLCAGRGWDGMSPDSCYGPRTASYAVFVLFRQGVEPFDVSALINAGAQQDWQLWTDGGEYGARPVWVVER